MEDLHGVVVAVVVDHRRFGRVVFTGVMARRWSGRVAFYWCHGSLDGGSPFVSWIRGVGRAGPNRKDHRGR